MKWFYTSKDNNNIHFDKLYTMCNVLNKIYGNNIIEIVELKNSKRYSYTFACAVILQV